MFRCPQTSVRFPLSLNLATVRWPSQCTFMVGLGFFLSISEVDCGCPIGFVVEAFRAIWTHDEMAQPLYANDPRSFGWLLNNENLSSGFRWTIKNVFGWKKNGLAVYAPGARSVIFVRFGAFDLIRQVSNPACAHTYHTRTSAGSWITEFGHSNGDRGQINHPVHIHGPKDFKCFRLMPN